jgi:hypothetical protein
LLRKAEILDAQEDKKYGKGKRADGLPEELQRRTDRLEKIRQARKELEADAAASHVRRRQEQAEEAMRAVEEAEPERKDQLQKQADRAAEKAEAARNLAIETAEVAGVEAPDLEPRAADAMPLRGLPTNAAGVPDAKAQRNFTDPDSHIMKRDNSFIQGYNCQAAVDGDYQIIVAIGVSNQPPDVEHHAPMLERIVANTGAVPTTVIEDAGYWSEDNVEACEAMDIDPYIATGRQKHGQPPPPSRGPIPKNLDAKGRMARKVRSKKGKETYARRKTIVEPVFGQTRGRGLRRFLLRGLEKVNGEWSLWSSSHNLLKLFRFKRAAGELAPAPG